VLTGRIRGTTKELYSCDLRVSFPTFLREMEKKWRSTARLLVDVFIFLSMKLDQVDVLAMKEVGFSIGLGEKAGGSVWIT
jgi:hypothetical protein